MTTARLHTLPHFLRHSVRMLRRRPGTSLLAVAALSLGVGLTTTMFSLVQSQLLRLLPYEDAERYMYVGTTHVRKNRPPTLSLHDYLDWRDAQTAFETFGAYAMTTVNLSDDAGFPERYNGCTTYRDFFEGLPVEPILGRLFDTRDHDPGAALVAVIGFDVWRHRFQSDPKVLGRKVTANGETAEVVGVMPEGFYFPLTHQVWLPLRVEPGHYERGRGPQVRILAKLRAGTSRSAAQKEMETVAARLAEDYPETNAGIGAFVQPFTEKHMWPGLRRTFLSALALIALGHLIACANVANLLMTRAVHRSRELAMCTALGASRRHVMGYVLVESLGLSLLGALGGLALAGLGVGYLAARFDWMPLPFWMVLELDLRGLGVAAALASLAALLAGLPAAFLASRADATSELGKAPAASGRKLRRVTRTLVVAEVAIASVLLICTGLFLRTLGNLHELDLAAGAEDIFTAGLTLNPADDAGTAETGAFVEELLAAVAADPAVTAAGAATSLPAAGLFISRPFAPEGATYAGPADYPQALRVVVTPGFFEVFAIPALQGRLFEDRDRPDSVPVAVVNRSFAARTWPGEDPIGRRLRLGVDEEDEPWREVVGLVPDAWPGALNDADQSAVYLPHAQTGDRTLILTLATRGATDHLAELLRRESRVLDPALPLFDLRTMADVLEKRMFFSDIFGELLGVLGLIALLQAAMGVYGVNAFSVEQRTSEIGVRMALGAARRRVFALVLEESSLSLAAGLSLGLVAAFFVTGSLRWALFGVDPRDPFVFAGTALFLSFVALAACAGPAFRASRIDPITALRDL